MKSFAFTMERMRSYKEQVLDEEKDALRRLRQQRDELERKIRELYLYCRKLELDFQGRQQRGVTRQEISAYHFYQENSRLTIEQLDRELAAVSAEVETQLKVVVARSQEVSSLDKLEEKQLETYRQEVSRETQETITEQVSNRATRKRMQSV